MVAQNGVIHDGASSMPGRKITASLPETAPRPVCACGDTRIVMWVKRSQLQGFRRTGPLGARRAHFEEWQQPLCQTCSNTIIVDFFAKKDRGER